MNYRKVTSVVCAFLSLFSFLVLTGISTSPMAYAAEEPIVAASPGIPVLNAGVTPDAARLAAATQTK